MSAGDTPAINADISDQLFILARKHLRTTVLLDPLEPLQGNLAALIEDRARTSRSVELPPFTGRSSTAPLLVQLDDWHDPLLDASIALAREQSSKPDGIRQVGGWIFGSETLDALAESIGRRLDVAHGAERRHLRVHDPRVQTCLIHMLDASRRASFCTGKTQWLSLREDGTLQIFVGAVDQPRRIITSAVDGTLWQRLHDISAINRATAAMRRLGQAFQSHWIAQIESLLRRARELGYDAQPDQIAFAVHGLTLGMAFDQHPRVREALSSASERGEGFCQAMAAFTPAELHAIAGALASTSARKGFPA